MSKINLCVALLIVSTITTGLNVWGQKGFEYNKKLGVGVNLGNALEAPREGAWGMRIQDDYFPTIKQRGFNHVRIPIRWSAHCQKEQPYKVEEEFFKRVEHVVNKALENDLLVVINIHHFEELYQDPLKHKEMFLALWRQIAERFKDYPWQLSFEIFNEPAQAFTPSIWNDFVRETLKVIRESNPSRIVIIDAPNWSHWSAVELLTVPKDENIIVSFHYYEPFNFTHQGAEWVSPIPPVGTKWQGTKAQVNEIEKHFRAVNNWSIKNNVPIYLGEFGAYSKADMESRVNWTRVVSQLAQKYGFSIAYWEFGAGFGIYDRSKGEWIEPLAEAVFGR